MQGREERAAVVEPPQRRPGRRVHVLGRVERAAAAASRSPRARPRRRPAVHVRSRRGGVVLKRRRATHVRARSWSHPRRSVQVRPRLSQPGSSRRISAMLPENQLERNPFCTSQVCATFTTVMPLDLHHGVELQHHRRWSASPQPGSSGADRRVLLEHARAHHKARVVRREEVLVVGERHLVVRLRCPSRW